MPTKQVYASMTMLENTVVVKKYLKYFPLTYNFQTLD